MLEKNLFVSYVEWIKICDLLVIKIVLEHELVQLIQPIARIHLALDRFNIIDFAVVCRSNECARGIVCSELGTSTAVTTSIEGGSMCLVSVVGLCVA
jgi:hypothetical protein